MEVGGVGGRDGLGAVEVDLADAVDGDDVAFWRAPVEDDGLAEVDGQRIGGDGGGGSAAAAGVWSARELLGLMPLALLVAASDGR